MDMQVLGVFSQPGLISVGDNYVKKGTTDPRHRGKQFLSGGHVKKGKTLDTLFGGEEGYKILYEGEKYYDPDVPERKARLEKKKLMVASNPFKPSNPPKRAVGLGSMYGTIGDHPEHMKDYNDTKVKVKGELAPRQIQTNPTKKGTYGYHNTTISEPAPYMIDPYDAVRRKEAEQRKNDLAKRMAAPFRSMSACKSHVVDLDNVVYDNHGQTRFPNPRATQKRRPETAPRPFIPSQPNKTGYNGTFSPFPEYMFDPYEGKRKQDREKKLKEKPTGYVFRPVSNIKTKPTRSIAFYGRGSV